jgi:hypothetical protein
MALTHLSNLIDSHLECQYGDHTHRSRHSNGLFPKKPKFPADIHILQRSASHETAKAIVERFANQGYTETITGSGYYLRRAGSERTINEVLCAGVKYLEWVE